MSALGLIWNAAGLAAFFMQMTMDLATLPDAQRIFYETTPAWATASFAVAVFGGVIGCLALLLRKSWALTMLLICLAGIVLQISHSLVISNGIEVFGSDGIILPIMTFSIAVFLIWFAKHSKQQGWLT
ncbi:MAG: hypothetical protein V3R81_06290 [Gammaproteobacteria bacterium]